MIKKENKVKIKKYLTIAVKYLFGSLVGILIIPHIGSFLQNMILNLFFAASKSFSNYFYITIAFNNPNAYSSWFLSLLSGIVTGILTLTFIMTLYTRKNKKNLDRLIEIENLKGEMDIEFNNDNNHISIEIKSLENRWEELKLFQGKDDEYFFSEKVQFEKQLNAVRAKYNQLKIEQLEDLKEISTKFEQFQSSESSLNQKPLLSKLEIFILHPLFIYPFFSLIILFINLNTIFLNMVTHENLVFRNETIKFTLCRGH
ncbi:MAG: hypothetical protein IPM69_04090 [Ignavibacteria bacterium]|nr:hypothetical protein [Ignavibacteria bacterium]